MLDMYLATYQIVWFVWLGIVMLRTTAPAADLATERRAPELKRGRLGLVGHVRGTTPL